jgi:phosphoglycerate kinase
MAELIGKSDGVKVVAGGDSVAAVKAADLQGEMTHISTGGGAALEFIEYGTLPGIEALSDKTLVV